MKPSMIVYTSNTGHTQEYAMLLGKRTGLPVYSLEEAMRKTSSSDTIIYLGWLMAGKVQGYAKATRRFHVAAVCGVGMGATGSQLQDLRKVNALPAAIPVFTLQGGFDITRLRGVYKLMMTVMAKTVGKGLAKKENRSPDEDEMLDMLLHGSSRVSEENLAAILEWYKNAQ